MRFFAASLAILGRHRRAYLAMNLLYYGLVIVTLVYGQFNRALHDGLMQAIGTAFGSGGPLGSVMDAYVSGRVVAAVALTFAINLLLGSFTEITLPSLIVPFSGLLIGVYRALLWGLLFSPQPGVALTGSNLLVGVLAGGVLLLEGQGYILAMLAAFVQGRALVWPHTIGAHTRKDGYLAGLMLTGRMYVWVAIVLAVAALYEVFAVAVMPR